MDSFELNKIIGAILGTCIIVLVTSFAAGAMFAPHMPEKPGFEIAVKEEAHGGAAEAAAPCASSFTAISKPGFSGIWGANIAPAAKLVTRTMMQVPRMAPMILLSSKESI